MTSTASCLLGSRNESRLWCRLWSWWSTGAFELWETGLIIAPLILRLIADANELFSLETDKWRVEPSYITVLAVAWCANRGPDHWSPALRFLVQIVIITALKGTLLQRNSQHTFLQQLLTLSSLQHKEWVSLDNDAQWHRDVLLNSRCSAQLEMFRAKTRSYQCALAAHRMLLPTENRRLGVCSATLPGVTTKGEQWHNDLEG